MTAGAYLPLNIDDKRRFEAHGSTFEVKFHSRATYVLSTIPAGERRRWGNYAQMVQDIQYVLDNGCLPPAKTHGF